MDTFLSTFVILTAKLRHLLIFLDLYMSSLSDNLWDRVLGEIQTQVSSANYLTLFKGTSLLSYEGNVLTIAAPSTMIIDLLNKRFYSIIKDTVDKLSNQNTEIIFVPKTPNEQSGEESGPLFAFADKPKVVGHLPHVRQDFTFQNFAVSGSNQLAYVSSTTVSKKVGVAYNPLFIYGPTGVGKTHLMHAVANEVYRDAPEKKIIYLTSEEFTNEVVEAIRTNDTARMKRKFRNLDLLIIDDVQFLAGKEKVQEELFHTFNSLVDGGAQVILSADRPPHEMRKVEKRLVSRFGGGLTVDIDTPDFELRCAILLTKAKKFNFDLPIETAKVIAAKTEDTRELEGLLLRVMSDSASNQEMMTPSLAEKALQSTELRKKTMYPEEVIRNICNFYEIKPTQLKGQKRDARLVRARQACMYVLKKENGLTYKEIGNILGGRDHTTIMHGVEKIENLLTQNKSSEEALGIKDLCTKSRVDN